MPDPKWQVEAKLDGKHLLCSECGEPVALADKKRFERDNNKCTICYDGDMKLRDRSYGIGKLYYARESDGY